jgi:hypothetical protein
MYARSVALLSLGALIVSVLADAAEARRRGGTAPRVISRIAPDVNRPSFTPAQNCGRQFATGDLVGHRAAAFGDGPHKLSIKNDVGYPVVIKISDEHDATLARFWVGSGQSGMLQGIPDGSYVVRYASDPILATDCESVLWAREAEKFPGPERMAITTEPNGDQYSAILEYTLYTVPGGNVQPAGISLPEFNED